MFFSKGEFGEWTDIVISGTALVAGVPTAASYNSKKDLLVVNVNYTTNVTTVNAALVYNGQACNNNARY